MYIRSEKIESSISRKKNSEKIYLIKSGFDETQPGALAVDLTVIRSNEVRARARQQADFRMERQVRRLQRAESGDHAAAGRKRPERD